MPFVSVLTPAYNAEKYISESIMSILNQSYPNFELIIVDDASTDNTFKIAQTYKNKDKRVRLYQNKTNKNIAESRNILISYARGDYIAWQDADDISTKDRLKQQVAFLQKNPTVGIVGGFLQFFNEHGIQSIRKYGKTDVQVRKKIFRFSPVAQPVAMIKREVFQNVGKYGVTLSPAEDIDMSFRIGERYKFANIQKVLLRYRIHSETATVNKVRKIEMITLQTRFKYIKSNRYHFSFIDLLYNMGHVVSAILLPTKLKIALFNAFRNSRK